MTTSDQGTIYLLTARSHIASQIFDLEPHTTLEDIARIVAPLLEAADQVLVVWDYRHDDVWHQEVCRRVEALRDVLAYWKNT